MAADNEPAETALRANTLVEDADALARAHRPAQPSRPGAAGGARARGAVRRARLVAVGRRRADGAVARRDARRPRARAASRRARARPVRRARRQDDPPRRAHGRSRRGRHGGAPSRTGARRCGRPARACGRAVFASRSPTRRRPGRRAKTSTACSSIRRAPVSARCRPGPTCAGGHRRRRSPSSSSQQRAILRRGGGGRSLRRRARLLYVHDLSCGERGSGRRVPAPPPGVRPRGRTRRRSARGPDRPCRDRDDVAPSRLDGGLLHREDAPSVNSACRAA